MLVRKSEITDVELKMTIELISPTLLLAVTTVSLLSLPVSMKPGFRGLVM